jgi:hypothetical protein
MSLAGWREGSDLSSEGTKKKNWRRGVAELANENQFFFFLVLNRQLISKEVHGNDERRRVHHSDGE